jgi:PAS domain-containing protein
VTIAPELFEALPDPVLVIDRDKILWVNARFAELAKAERASLVGRALDEVLCPLDCERLVRILDGEPVSRAGLFRLGFHRATGNARALDCRVTVAAPGVLLLT